MRAFKNTLVRFVGGKKNRPSTFRKCLKISILDYKICRRLSLNKSKMNKNENERPCKHKANAMKIKSIKKDNFNKELLIWCKYRRAKQATIAMRKPNTSEVLKVSWSLEERQLVTHRRDTNANYSIKSKMLLIETSSVLIVLQIIQDFGINNL